MSKQRQRKLAAVEPKWTATDLDGEAFMALCRRNAQGEVYLWQFGVGSSAGLWNACYRDLVPAGDRGENRPGLRQGYSPVQARGLANRAPVDGSGAPDATGQTPNEQQEPVFGAAHAVSAEAREGEQSLVARSQVSAVSRAFKSPNPGHPAGTVQGQPGHFTAPGTGQSAGSGGGPVSTAENAAAGATGLARHVPIPGLKHPAGATNSGAERAVSARPATEFATAPHRDARRPCPPAGGRPWNGGVQ